MMPIGAEKFEPEFDATHLISDTACKFKRVFEIWRVNSDEDRIGHVWSTAVYVGRGGTGVGAVVR